MCFFGIELLLDRAGQKPQSTSSLEHHFETQSRVVHIKDGEMETHYEITSQLFEEDTEILEMAVWLYSIE